MGINTAKERAAELGIYKNKEDARPVHGREINNIIDSLTDGTSEDFNVAAGTIGTLNTDSTIIAKGTVTQLTSITTGITLNKAAGVITTVSSTLAAGTNAAFTVSNSLVTANSVILLTVDDSATAGIAKLNVQEVTSGSFRINVTNIHGTNAFNNTLNIHYIVM